jgi:hypothetical protein
MAEGFKVAEVYADFHVDVDKGLDEAAARIKSRGREFDQMGRTHGEGYSRGFGNGANLRPAMVDQVSTVKSGRVAFATEGRQAGKAFADGFGNSKLTTGGVSVGSMDAAGQQAGEELGRGTTKGYERASKETDKKVDETGKKAQSSFAALQFAGAFAGLPAAAAVSAAGVGLALAAVPMVFAGIGVAALKSNEQVVTALHGMASTVTSSAQEMVAPLAGPVTGAIHDVTASFVRLEPQIKTAMVNSVPAVGLLADSVTALAENTMPGLVTATKASVAPLEGLKSIAGQTGAGLTDLFTNAATGSQDAKVGMVQFGGVTRDLLGFTGSLLATLASGSAGVLPQFRATLGQLETTVLTLAHGAMPALQGASSSVMGTVGGLLGVVNLAAGALGSWAAPLGSMGGALYTTNTAAKLFGTSLGETGFGLKAFTAETDKAGNSTTPFKTAMANTEAGGNKLTRGLKSVVEAGVNPLGLAMLAGGFILDAFGQSQQKAAAAAATHKEAVRTLSDAIRQDNGVLGEHVAAVNVAALTDKNAANNLATYGATMADAKLAIQGSSVAMQSLTGSSNTMIASIGRSSGLTDLQTQALMGANQALLHQGGSFESVSTSANGYARGTKESATASTALKMALYNLTDADRKRFEQLANGNGAIGTQVKAQMEAHDAYVISEMALHKLTAAQVEARDATAKHTTALFAEQDALLAQRGAVLTTQDAQDKYNTTMASGSATAQEKLKVTLELERAFSAQEQAVYNAAVATSKSASDDGKKTDGLIAMRAEVVRLAENFKGPLPESLKTTIGGFSATEAAGLTVSINQAGDAVYKLPDGKEIAITGNTKNAKDAINALPAYTDKAGPGVFAVTANTNKATGQTNAAVQYADGSTGVIKLDANRDPATGQTMVAVQFANGQTGRISIDAFNQAAKDRTIEAVTLANGSVGWIMVKANTNEAEAQANYVARTRYAQIQFTAVGTGITAPDVYYRGPHAATGGLIAGGAVQHRGFAVGGQTGSVDVTGGGLMAGPGGTRGDGIAAFSLSDKEFVVNAADTARNLDALIYANRGGTVVPAPGGAAGGSIANGGDGSAAPSGATNNYYNTFNVQETDVYTLATLVSRELSLRAKTGASM